MVHDQGEKRTVFSSTLGAISPKESLDLSFLALTYLVILSGPTPQKTRPRSLFRPIGYEINH